MKKEFIGKEAEITHSNGKFEGKIINETKNMLHLKTKNQIKKFIKNTITINIEGKIIQGNKITKRPQDRIKK